MKRLVLGIAVASLFLGNAPVANAAEIQPIGCTITGDLQANVLYGTSGADIICGLGGNDTIYGLGGDDIVYAGSGEDYIEGGDDQDTIYAGVGDDNIYGNSGSDNLWGESGSDSLSGGTDLDLLRGGEGYDTCVAFKSDNYLSNDCFYDKSAPKLRSISFSSAKPKVDATKEGASLEVRFRVADASGFKSLYAMFYNTSVSDPGSTVISLNFENLNKTCESLIQDDPTAQVENCRLSGTINNGLYTAKLVIPGTLRKGNYVLSELGLEDVALNRSYRDAPAIKKLHQAIGFSQIGTPDRRAPVLTGAKIIGTKVVKSESDRLIARVSFRDMGGHAIQNFWLSYKTPETFMTTGAFTQFASVRNLAPCDQPHGIDIPCLFSGTPSRGVLEFSLNVDSQRTDIRALHRAQPLVPDGYSISDSLGNQYGGDLPSRFISALTYYKGFSSPAISDDKDAKAPTLAALSVDKKSVSTGVSAQAIVVTARIKDQGVGVNRFIDSSRLELFLEGGGGVACVLRGTATGTAKNATFTFVCTLPAHAASGAYKLWLSGEDMSLRGNQYEYSPTELATLKFVSTIKNG